MTWYAVSCGREVGVFSDWKKVESSVVNHPGGNYKVFKTEAQALRYLNPDAVISRDGGGRAAPEALLINKVYISSYYYSGKAGYGAVIVKGDGSIETYYGPVAVDRNFDQSRSELYALYAALSITKENIIVYIDSSYVYDIMTKRIAEYSAAKFKGVKHADLLQACREYMVGRQVIFRQANNTGSANTATQSNNTVDMRHIREARDLASSGSSLPLPPLSP